MLDRENERRIQLLRGKELNLNTAAVQRLAREFGLPFDVVQRTYEEVLVKIQEEARIRAFLPIFVSRHVREQLRHAFENVITEGETNHVAL
jgi:histone H3/H4